MVGPAICLAFLFTMPVSAAISSGDAADGNNQPYELSSASSVTTPANLGDTSVQPQSTTWRRFNGNYYINLPAPSFTFWFPIGPITVPQKTRSMLFKLISPRRADFNLLVSYDGNHYEPHNRGVGKTDSLILRVSPGKEFYMYVQCIRGHGTAYVKLWRR